jgi:hypothetical protein
MSIILSLQQGHEAVVVSEELRELVSRAYAHQGKMVEVPAEIVKQSIAELSSKTTDEILAIRRRERAVSSQTLSFSFA